MKFLKVQKEKKRRCSGCGREVKSATLCSVSGSPLLTLCKTCLLSIIDEVEHKPKTYKNGKVLPLL